MMSTHILRVAREGRYWVDAVHYALRRRGDALPHVLKRRIIHDHRRAYGLRMFVETGTFRGDMTAAMARHFDEVHSIELGAELYRDAAARFRHVPRVHVHHGDSALVLPRILRASSQPALFWLDAHYSAGFTARGDLDTPIVAELRHIFRQRTKGHVILIDDARCFTGEAGYPRLDALAELVAAEAPHFAMAVAADIIRLLPDPVRTPIGPPNAADRRLCAGPPATAAGR